MQFRYLLAIAAMLCFLAASWALESRVPALAPAPETHASDIDDMPSDPNRYLSSLPKNFLMPSDDVGRLLLHEYGSLFVARDGAVPPKMVIFPDEASVTAFQSQVKIDSENFGSTKIELQKAAMKELREAIDEGRKLGLSISPRGADSGRRSYEHTVDLWASRVGPGMKHWVAAGKISQKEANRILALSPFDQVPEILGLEAKGLSFAKSLDKSIIYSVAPPGTSQHLSMLALDVKEYDNGGVRAVLAKHGWFQTVTSDLPHFTFLGAKETDLPKLGLKAVQNGGRTFWVPDLN